METFVQKKFVIIGCCWCWHHAESSSDNTQDALQKNSAVHPDTGLYNARYIVRNDK
jgi:hypothetical protein